MIGLELIFSVFVAICSLQILRQFEALMGGSAHPPRLEATSTNNHHPAAANQLPSTYSDPLLAAENHNHHKPDVSPTGVAHSPTPPSPPSSVDVITEDEERPPPEDQEEEAARTDDAAEESERHTEQPCVARLSLFSGMELVTRGRPLCNRASSPTETDATEEDLAVCDRISLQASSLCGPAASDRSQPVSAFSFLNF